MSDATDPPGKADKAEREGGPSPIDVHVGARIRVRRLLMNLSQERLGEALGLTFQQIQKYERGANRVGASRLFDLSRVLDVPIGFFFDDLPDGSAPPGGQGLAPPRLAGGFADQQDRLVAPDDPMTRKESVELIRAYWRIRDLAVRRKMFELIRSMADLPEG